MVEAAEKNSTEMDSKCLPKNRKIPTNHHWMIEAPKGPTSVGTCRKCGEERSFNNSANGLWDANVGADGMRKNIQLRNNSDRVNLTMDDYEGGVMSG